MAVDIYKRKGCGYIKSNGTTFIFFILTIFQDSISQFKLAKHKTSQVKPSKLKIYIHKHNIVVCFELNVNFGTLSSLQMFSIVQSICLRITIFNSIVQFHRNMCTKSPVREIATIEGNIYTPKTDKLSQPMGKWAFFFFFFLVIIYNMKYTSTIIHIFPLLVIVIFPWRNPKNNTNRK